MDTQNTMNGGLNMQVDKEKIIELAKVIDSTNPMCPPKYKCNGDCDTCWFRFILDKLGVEHNGR